MTGPIAVTGATGFLGGHICDALLEQGLDVRAVVRDPNKGAHLTALHIPMATADLADADALLIGLKGCSALVANAALGSWAGPIDRYMAVNVHGTARLLRAAAQAGVPRVVLISTVAVYRTRLNSWMDENAALHGPKRRYFLASNLTTDWRYALSKSLAEAQAWDLARELGLQLTVLRPGPIFGPRDPKLTQRYGRLMGQRRCLVPTVGVPQLAALDCARAVPGALATPQSIGRAYNLAGPPTKMVDVLRTLTALTGAGPQLVPVPVPLWVGYRTDRARDELGFISRPLDETLAEVVAAGLG